MKRFLQFCKKQKKTCFLVLMLLATFSANAQKIETSVKHYSIFTDIDDNDPINDALFFCQGNGYWYAKFMKSRFQMRDAKFLDILNIEPGIITSQKKGKNTLWSNNGQFSISTVSDGGTRTNNFHVHNGVLELNKDGGRIVDASEGYFQVMKKGKHTLLSNNGWFTIGSVTDAGVRKTVFHTSNGMLELNKDGNRIVDASEGFFQVMKKGQNTLWSDNGQFSISTVSNDGTRTNNFHVHNGVLELNNNGTRILEVAEGSLVLKSNGADVATISNNTLTIDKVKLNVGSFPDYVFKDDYELKSLSEVNSFIESHGHLPNMPSEQEVLENGMDVGKVNTVLVEKIEEMTLYAIDQEQKIENLTKKLEKVETILQNLMSKN